MWVYYNFYYHMVIILINLIHTCVRTYYLFTFLYHIYTSTYNPTDQNDSRYPPVLCLDPHST